MTWHAVCPECDEFEEIDEDFGRVFDAAAEHQDETGHEISGGRVD